MVWVDLTNIFDFDIFFDGISLPKPYAGLRTEHDRGVNSCNLYRLLGHSTFVLSREITSRRVRPSEVDDCMFLGYATFLKRPATRVSPDTAESSQVGRL